MNAFNELAEGHFKTGLDQLSDTDGWRDTLNTLDGPFYLGFPDAPGWGEGLLVASLLKRHAVAEKSTIEVVASKQVHSVLQHDGAFRVHAAEGLDPARVRSPLAVLRHALLGDLLNVPFAPINTGHVERPDRFRPKIGIAWASIANAKAIPEKLIPLAAFLGVIGNSDIDVVSFQRGILEADTMSLRKRFGDACSIVADQELNSNDQTNVVRQVLGLDCMLTISTTTVHMAACLGVPVILLAARRKGQQWFWRAQREHHKYLYPSVDVHLGRDGPSEWWNDCMDSARAALQAWIDIGSKQVE